MAGFEHQPHKYTKTENKKVTGSQNYYADSSLIIITGHVNNNASLVKLQRASPTGLGCYLHQDGAVRRILGRSPKLLSMPRQKFEARAMRQSSFCVPSRTDKCHTPNIPMSLETWRESVEPMRNPSGECSQKVHLLYPHTNHSLVITLFYHPFLMSKRLPAPFQRPQASSPPTIARGLRPCHQIS